MRLDSPSLDGILRIAVTRTVAKEILTCEMGVTHSQRLSITPRCLATGNNFENLKIMGGTSQSTGMNVVKTCLLLGRQRASE